MPRNHTLKIRLTKQEYVQLSHDSKLFGFPNVASYARASFFNRKYLPQINTEHLPILKTTPKNKLN
ncbi:hypothetical protein COV18_02660 [Candidatus Woesearchaeota archaeon CG10_big_fil_rev_8_21_14_0_10_37_12]|nr:MAG: hypothetical protein COV18_02660 [Candidatus Woesearchaeota archaeon CG10_big_fil_rev_8_21_14_0_10_37_12]